MPPTYFDTMPSPLGELLLAASNDGVTHVLFTPLLQASGFTQSWISASDLIRGAVAQAGDAKAAMAYLQLARGQLNEYFTGRREAFTVPLAASGTLFQQTVWRALLDIPYGRTWSYGDVAMRVARPRAMRAVGLANGRNPISIVVPCHRVVGANGRLTGYGGGIARKQWLLALESGAALSSVVNE